MVKANLQHAKPAKLSRAAEFIGACEESGGSFNSQQVSSQPAPAHQEAAQAQEAPTPTPTYSEELFDRYPPPPELEGELSEEEIGELKVLLGGKPMRIAAPNHKDLESWGLQCYEQYAIYDAYAFC